MLPDIALLKRFAHELHELVSGEVERSLVIGDWSLVNGALRANERLEGWKIGKLEEWGLARFARLKKVAEGLFTTPPLTNLSA